MSKDKAERGTEAGLPASGPGALCPEAQADGVPCQELGRDCELCEKAVPVPEGEKKGPG